MCRAGRQGRGGKAAPDRLGAIHLVLCRGGSFGVSSLRSSLRWVRRGIGRLCDPLPAPGNLVRPAGAGRRDGLPGSADRIRSDPADSRVLSRGVGRSRRASSAAAAGRAGVPGPEVQEVRSAPVGFKRPGRNRPKTRNFGPGNARRAGDPGRTACPECAPMVAAPPEIAAGVAGRGALTGVRSGAARSSPRAGWTNRRRTVGPANKTPGNAQFPKEAGCGVRSNAVSPAPYGSVAPPARSVRCAFSPRLGVGPAPGDPAHDPVVLGARPSVGQGRGVGNRAGGARPLRPSAAMEVDRGAPERRPGRPFRVVTGVPVG